MKKLFQTAITSLALLLSTGAFMACSKKDTPAPTDNKWVKVYKDVILGDQKNYSIGQFFKTQTGEVVPLESAITQAKYLTLMYFTGYGSTPYFTFPGDGFSTGDLNLDENRLFHETDLGIEFWPHASLNTGEIMRASKGFKEGTSELDFMTPAEFNSLIANPSWDNFDKKFKECNSGAADLSFVSNYVLPENGAIYLIQLNDQVRGIVCIKNLVTSGGSAGGSIKFDIILEGKDNYNTLNNTQYVQPSKD